MQLFMHLSPNLIYPVAHWSQRNIEPVQFIHDISQGTQAVFISKWLSGQITIQFPFKLLNPFVQVVQLEADAKHVAHSGLQSWQMVPFLNLPAGQVVIHYPFTITPKQSSTQISFSNENPSWQLVHVIAVLSQSRQS